ALARFSLGEPRRARSARVAAVRIRAHGVSAATIVRRALVDVFLAVLARKRVGALALVAGRRLDARAVVLTGIVGASVVNAAAPSAPRLPGPSRASDAARFPG